MARKFKKNYDLFSGFGYFTPTISELIILIVWFGVGMLISTVIAGVLGVVMQDMTSSIEVVMIISYPIMFIPAMMYASLKSHKNALFEEEFPLDNNRFGKVGGLLCAVMAALATLALGMILESVNVLLPKMPEALEKAFESLTGGNFWVDFLSVSIFAPLFEEWLCRGEVLRSLLHFKKDNGERGIKPVWAIIISALFFALIHLNPWQAVPAFGLGCLFGYVYYKTGSLKLTMLMHCVNNTFALICSHIDSLAESDSWIDFLGTTSYTIIALACALLLILIIRKFKDIKE